MCQYRRRRREQAWLGGKDNLVAITFSVQSTRFLVIQVKSLFPSLVVEPEQRAEKDANFALSVAALSFFPRCFPKTTRFVVSLRWPVRILIAVR